MRLRLSAGTRLNLLFVLLSIVVCALVNPGNFEMIDTTRRWQVARWIRLGEPPVDPGDVGFGIVGRNGVPHAWYGVGQSLLIVPFDAVVGATVSPYLGRLGLTPVKQRQVAELLIAFLMQSFLTAGVLILAHRILVSFEFTNVVSTAGALALLFGTTCLQYVQCAAENLLLVLLALCALCAIRRRQLGGGRLWPVMAGAACGFAILVRLTSLLETVIFAMFAVSVADNRKQFFAGYLPPVATALLVDRWYQYYRFGELFSTYMGVFARQSGHPASTTFPFSYPFSKGFLGALFSPDKSVFLFDPLLAAVVLVAALIWRDLAKALRTLILWLALLLFLYIAAHAKYYDFGGDIAWGHRFVVLPVQLLSLFAVPLLVKHGRTLPGLARRAAWTVVFLSIVLQAASTTMAPNVEVIQRLKGLDKGVLVNRAINLAQITEGKLDGRRFRGIPVAWQTLNYLPFQLRFRFPRLAVWAIAGWMGLLVSLPLLVATTLWSAVSPSLARELRVNSLKEYCHAHWGHLYP